ncbi:MAG TPA: hypothetical protein VL995_02190 [Cellvibrio sp.]|nr:hypothetical protein [Cellvibrio sp.]
MASELSLPVLIMGEVILALLVLLFFILHYIRKQKKLIKKLLEKFNEIKSAYEDNNRNDANFYANNKHTDLAPSIADYLEQSLADSLARYEKYTRSVHPHFDINHPFSGRIAALRSVYLTAEKEVYEDRGITHAGWGMFEKKLADIVRWQDKKNSHKQEVRDTRMRVLQDKVAALKGYEEENKSLRRKVQRLQDYQQELEQYQADSQRTIASLQSMLDNLKQLQHDHSSVQPQEHGLWQDKAYGQLDHISSQKMPPLQSLLQELKTYPSTFSADDRRKMEDQLNMLEIELFKSDQYIGNLKKELKDAKQQATNYALMLRDTKASTTGDEVISFDNMDLVEQKNIIAEIHLLRDNNRRQRDIIAQLEREISALRGSIDTSDTGEVTQKKEQEIVRLEKLVKECQNCIDTLENEVDHLYSQLQQRTERMVGEAQAQPGALNDELTMITSELEKTVVHYQQLHAINRLILDLMKCDSVELLGRQLVQFIKAFHAPMGFGIYSSAGRAEYFPAALFDQSLKDLSRSTNFTDQVTHLDEGTLFTYSKIHVMLLPSPPDVHPILETSLQGLVCTADECIRRIESDKRKPASPDNAEWTSLTKNLLSDLDIQYAYQVEENRKTFNHFINELRKAYHLLELEGPGAIVLDNAINEFEERMHLLINSSEVIDTEINKLITHMEKING